MKQTKAKQSTLKYRGDVKVSIKKDSKTISSKIYHNAGTKYLYHFLCLCLAGQYSVAKNLRPMRIRLFKNDGAPTEDAVITQNLAVSPYITMSQSPTMLPHYSTTNPGLIDNYQTTLHFTIPYSYVTGNEINELAIYSTTGAGPQGGIDNYQASIALVKQGDNGLKWDPITITGGSTSSNYSLIIEWTMSFSLEG